MIADCKLTDVEKLASCESRKLLVLKSLVFDTGSPHHARCVRYRFIDPESGEVLAAADTQASDPKPGCFSKERTKE